MADFGKLNYSVSLKPTSAFPLDARCYFESLAEAQAAALTAEEVGSTNTVYYYGQKLVVVADGFATWYTIQPDKTLKVDSTGTAKDSEKLGGQLPSYYAKASDIPSLDGYAKTSDIPSLDGYAKTSDIPSIPTKVSAFENDKGYLTDHQSLEEYAKNSALEDAVEEITAIAQGKCACYVFDTVEALDTWLGNTANTENLKTGDVFLIRQVNVPDYWWDKEEGKKQILETTKVDLTEYAKKSEIPSLEGYAKTSDIPSLEGYAKTTDIPTVPTKLSELNNDKDFLTKAEIEALIESTVLNGYLGGKRIRYVDDANDGGIEGYLTVKKG